MRGRTAPDDGPETQDRRRAIGIPQKTIYRRQPRDSGAISFHFARHAPDGGNLSRTWGLKRARLDGNGFLREDPAVYSFVRSHRLCIRGNRQNRRERLWVRWLVGP